MPISFEIPENIVQQQQMTHFLAETVMRPFSRELDENEHARPTEFVNMIWPVLRDQQAHSLQKMMAKALNGGSEGGEKKEKRGPRYEYLRIMSLVEELSWGDVGVYLCLPSPQLAGSAIEAVGTIEQKERLLRRFAEGDQPV